MGLVAYSWNTPSYGFVLIVGLIAPTLNDNWKLFVAVEPTIIMCPASQHER